MPTLIACGVTIAKETFKLWSCPSDFLGLSMGVLLSSSVQGDFSHLKHADALKESFLWWFVFFSLS